MHVYESLPELIGKTPILELKRSGSVWPQIPGSSRIY